MTGEGLATVSRHTWGQIFEQSKSKIHSHLSLEAILMSENMAMITLNLMPSHPRMSQI